jgi:hypothetical protein
MKVPSKAPALQQVFSKCYLNSLSPPAHLRPVFTHSLPKTNAQNFIFFIPFLVKVVFKKKVYEVSKKESL